MQEFRTWSSTWVNRCRWTATRTVSPVVGHVAIEGVAIGQTIFEATGAGPHGGVAGTTAVTA
jgi:hypothetical protein